MSPNEMTSLPESPGFRPPSSHTILYLPNELALAHLSWRCSLCVPPPLLLLSPLNHPLLKVPPNLHFDSQLTSTTAFVFKLSERKRGMKN